MTTGGLVLVATAALACGAVNSVAGGGSLLLFPALVAAGLPRLGANVTNSVITWPGYLGGVAGYRAELADQAGRARQLAIATVAGSATGCALLLATPSGAFDVVVPWLVLAASALIGVQPWLGRWLGTAATDHERRGARLPAVFLACIYGGYFGGALGVILIAVLTLTLDDTLHRLTALRSVLSLLDATVSVLVFGLFGPVHWTVVAVAAPCTLVGGFVGARALGRVPDTGLRVAVVLFGVAAAIVLAVA